MAVFLPTACHVIQWSELTVVRLPDAVLYTIGHLNGEQEYFLNKKNNKLLINFAVTCASFA